MGFPWAHLRRLMYGVEKTLHPTVEQRELKVWEPLGTGGGRTGAGSQND